MNRERASKAKLPKGVTALSKPRGGRGFRASIRKGKGAEVHLGLYETPWLAAFAYGVAARALGREAPPVDAPRREQPGADRVRDVTAKVHARLGLDSPAIRPEDPPDTEDLLTLFAVAVVGFWRGQAAEDSGGPPGAGLDAAAARVVEAAGLLFWSRAAGHPTPLEAMTELLARRLDQAFRRGDLTREVLDDDGDEPRRVARWLVWPETSAGSRVRGFRDELVALYEEVVGPQDLTGERPAWAERLGVAAPYTLENVRAAYLALSRDHHPDAGGTDADFVRLREAYEAARAYCSSRPGTD